MLVTSSSRPSVRPPASASVALPTAKKSEQENEGGREACRQCGVKVAVADADTTESPSSLLPPPSSPSFVLDDASDAIPPWIFKERGRKEASEEGDPIIYAHSTPPMARRGMRPARPLGWLLVGWLRTAGAPVLQADAVAGRWGSRVGEIIGRLMRSWGCGIASNFEATSCPQRSSLPRLDCEEPRQRGKSSREKVVVQPPRFESAKRGRHATPLALSSGLS